MHRIHEGADAGRFFGALRADLDPDVRAGRAEAGIVVDLLDAFVQAPAALDDLKLYPHGSFPKARSRRSGYRCGSGVDFPKKHAQNQRPRRSSFRIKDCISTRARSLSLIPVKAAELY